jgi:hypothetical protein
MKFFLKILIGLICFSSAFSELAVLTPGATIENRVKYNDEMLYSVMAKDLKPNHFYKIMVHYLGSVH